MDFSRVEELRDGMWSLQVPKLYWMYTRSFLFEKKKYEELHKYELLQEDIFSASFTSCLQFCQDLDSRHLEKAESLLPMLEDKDTLEVSRCNCMLLMRSLENPEYPYPSKSYSLVLKSLISIQLLVSHSFRKEVHLFSELKHQVEICEYLIAKKTNLGLELLNYLDLPRIQTIIRASNRVAQHCVEGKLEPVTKFLSTISHAAMDVDNFDSLVSNLLNIWIYEAQKNNYRVTDGNVIVPFFRGDVCKFDAYILLGCLEEAFQVYSKHPQPDTLYSHFPIKEF